MRRGGGEERAQSTDSRGEDILRTCGTHAHIFLHASEVLLPTEGGLKQRGTLAAMKREGTRTRYTDREISAVNSTLKHRHHRHAHTHEKNKGTFW